MSAPVTERGRTAVRGRTAAIPAQRGLADGGAGNGAAAAAPAVPATDPAAGTGQAARSTQKAYARRDERVRRVAGVRQARTAVPAGRPQFVLLIMVLLAVGLVATLWLSTAAAADSYQLQDATAEARVLSEQAERLKQDVAVLASAPELARRAGALGMMPVRDPARLVVAPDGSVEVVGQPRAAVAPPPPEPPAPPAVEQEPAPGDTAPGSTAPDGTAPDDTAQLAAPAADEAEATAVDGDAPPAAAEGAREDEPGQDTAGQDTAGQDAAAGRDAGPSPGARAGGGGTDAG